MVKGEVVGIGFKGVEVERGCGEGRSRGVEKPGVEIGGGDFSVPAGTKLEVGFGGLPGHGEKSWGLMRRR